MACPCPPPGGTVLCSPDLEARRKRFAGGIALAGLIAVGGCGGGEREGLNYRATQPGLSDPERPRFALNGIPRQIGGFPEAKDTSPAGCDTAYVNTWACGPLKPGREATFVWTVTPVKAGPFTVSWRVAAGLNGKAKAVATGGGAPTGSFSGSVSRAAPKVRIANDGKTVVIETR